MGSSPRMRIVAGAVLPVAAACLLASCGKTPAPGEVLYRVDCGSSKPYTDRTGAVWSADQVYCDSAKWGAIGGRTVLRDSIIPIDDSLRPGIYRTERYTFDGYSFPTPNGYYTVRLHFAETCDFMYRRGQRRIDVAIGPRNVLREIDPYYEAGGFSKPCVYEITGVRPTKGRIVVWLAGSDNAESVNGIGVETLNGIEVLAGKRAPLRAVKIMGHTGEGAWETNDTIGLTGVAHMDSVLVIGNGKICNYAVPRSLQIMINTLQDSLHVKVRCFNEGGAEAWMTWSRDSAAVLASIRSGNYRTVITLDLNNQQEVWEGLTPRCPQSLPAIASAAKSVRARTILLWDPRIDPSMRDGRATCRQFGLDLAPVGLAQLICSTERPDIPLETNGGSFPSIYCSYLTECMLYTVLTGRRVATNRHTAFMGQIAIPQAIGEYLSDLAWRVYRESVEDGQQGGAS